jgi:hypothetical protein
MKRDLDMEETQQWLDVLTHASNNEASQDIVATACMLYQGFQTWSSRSKGITLAKLRRKFKSVKNHEATPFLTAGQEYRRSVGTTSRCRRANFGPLSSTR